jgi:arylsulfatase
LREVSPFGPFDRWPTGLGFEYFYGFQGGDCDQWNPNLFENTIPVDPPSFPNEGYILDGDLADHAIDWLRGQRTVADGRPFFMWYAPGTAHAPHHAPAEWIDKYSGCFAHGWDEQREKTFSRQRERGIIPPGTQLTPRPEEIPSWQSLSKQEKRVAERLQEAFAGALSYCDHQIGRVLDAVEELGELDNTLVFYVAGDNGPSAEGNLYGQVNKFASMNGEPESVDEMIKRIDLIGTEYSYNNYPVGWAWAGSSPLKWFKQVASHFGGTRNGLVVSWPGGISSDTVVREQFHHCIDVVPTILELCGIEEPSVVNGVSQKPIQGTSMAYAFEDADATSRRHTQYFELRGHRALYSNGWIASARHSRLPWAVVDASFDDPDDAEWELYHVDRDFSQANNLAETESHRLRALQDLWWAEAGRNDVMPLDVRFVERYDPANRPGTANTRERWYYPGRVARIPEELAPALKGRSHRITASITSKSGRDCGVVVSAGGRFGGYALFLRDGVPVYVYNAYGDRYRIEGQREIPPGRFQITVEVVLDSEERGSAGTVEILVNGEPQASGRVNKTVRRFYSYTETFDIGRETGSPVDESYQRPYAFTGDIDAVLFELLEPR